MLNYLIRHTYCGHTFSKLSFISCMLKIFSLPTITCLVLVTAIAYKTNIYAQLYFKYIC